MYSDFDTLLIPVESQVRELDGKLLLACVAAEKGYKVVIGSRAHIHFYASKLKNSIYIAKSMRRFSDRMFSILHDLGHKIVAWDEEALVRLPDKEYYLHRLSPNTFKHIEHLFAWGASNAQVFRQYPGYRNQPIHESGNPRIDILRPELRKYFQPEVDKIRQQYNDYILVNTNFGQVNHFIHTQGIKEASRDKNFDATMSNSYMSNRFAHKKKLLAYFKTLVVSLAKTFPNINFILRPHPSENIEFWLDLLKECPNTFVINNGNVIPWILASTALISNGCTTAIEASILDKPTLGYHPISDIEVDDILPKALCDVSITNEQLFEKIDAVLTNNYKIGSANKIILSQHLANLSGELAVDHIVNTLHDSYANDIFSMPNTLSRIKGMLHNESRTVVKKLNGIRKSHRNSIEYHKHRFPTITVDYLQERATRLDNLTNRFHNINISRLSDHIFSIAT